jgi:hypothetical protein
MTTWTTEDLENAKKKIEEDEYSGGIPIPFAGWMQQDKDDTEEMLRHQLQILQAEIDLLKKFYEDRLEAGRKREETMMGTIETLLKKAQEK